jgi:GntR family transcriptional regulator
VAARESPLVKMLLMGASPSSGGRMSLGEGPKYRRIAADLRARIRTGQFPAGSVLPPQRRLSEDYDVTLMTMRQALRVLEEEGVIAQQAGRGTYVLPVAPSHHLQGLRSLADELGAQGVPLSTEVLGRQERRLPRDVARELGADEGARGLRLERLRSIEGRALLHQVSWIPQPWGEAVRDCDFTVEPLYASLGRVCGLSVARAQETLAARALPDRIARLLERPAGGPVLVSERITYDEQERAFVADSAVILDQRLRIVTERRASSMTNTWQLA